MIKHVQIKVTGKVQGVGFRFSAFDKFVELELTGTAENGNGGSVEIHVSGEEENLKKFLRWCQQGPSGARVEKMDYRVVESPAEIDQPEKEFQG